MPYRYRTTRRQLTLLEAEEILRNVPDSALEGKSKINPVLTRKMALGIFKGACIEYRKQGRQDDFLLGAPVSNNILDEFGEYEEKGETNAPSTDT